MFGFDQQEQDQTPGDRFVGRVMAAEYNLSVQRERGAQKASPGGILTQMLGQWLSERSR